jgi:hypothetical protein
LGFGRIVEARTRQAWSRGGSGHEQVREVFDFIAEFFLSCGVIGILPAAPVLEYLLWIDVTIKDHVEKSMISPSWFLLRSIL